MQRGGGRAALYKQFQESQNQPGPGGDAASQNPAMPVLPAEDPHPPPVPKVGGRGALYQKLLEAKQAAASTSTVPAPPAEPAAVPRSGGRGQMYRQLLEREQAQQQGPSSSQAPVSPSPSVESLTQQVKRIEIAEPRQPPPRGTSGRECQVTANYIPLLMKPGRAIHEYEVRFNPPVDDMKVCEKMLLFQNRETFQGKRRTFDGVTLYMPHKLPPEAHNLTSTHPVTNEPHTIVITYRRERSMLEGVHMYNVLFNKIQEELSLTRLTRSEYFSQNLAVPIPQHRLEVWPGYCTAVEQFDGGLMLNCNVTSKVLRTQTVLDLISDLARAGGGMDWKSLLQKQIIGQSVMVRTPVKLYRVDDIDFEQNPMSTFQKPDGTEMTYVEYHQRKGIEIKDWKQPLLVHRPKPSKRQHASMLMLVPELCFLTGLTDDMRSDFKVMKDVAMYTRVSPNQRMASLRNFIDNIKKNENCVKLLDDWGLQVPEDTVNLTARTLPPEVMIFGRNAQASAGPEADFNRAVMKENMLHAVDLYDWVIVYCNRDERCASLFCDTITKICPQLGVRIQTPAVEKLPNDRTETYINALKRCIGNQTQMIVIIFPTSRDDRYAAVKRLCCVDKPIPSQVINARTISRPDKIRPIVQKIALQINCKLGGALWAIKLPLKNAMICGIDTYHDTKIKARCVVGFVASMNSSFTRWHSQTIMQSINRELPDSLRVALRTALTNYYKVNNTHPDQIIIFRDGVGDGQLKVIEQYEVTQMKSAFNSVSPDYNPSLIFVVCQKRVNTRIFLPTGRNFENPHPGTIVDHSITRRYMSPHWFDFYLVSQFVRQGTVTPTHYIVVYNDSSLDADKIQKLTYKMCHLYYNWPGTIRVPAPCQYAHKLAHLVGCSIHKEPSGGLCDKLFFL